MYVTCPDCKAVVSSRAHTCQSCGSHRTPKGQRATALTALALSALLLWILTLVS